MKELAEKLLYRISVAELISAAQVVIRAKDSGNRFELDMAINYLNEVRSRAQDLLDAQDKQGRE
jgi:hypothetical protein